MKEIAGIIEEQIEFLSKANFELNAVKDGEEVRQNILVICEATQLLMVLKKEGLA
ncbi:hypothetical protein [Effusibacillus dendaii]|uniref:Uncharacterized protein n=1 Tax=Effusibacillus dendaii TaxID=2743772 RepID=A0A7I8DAY1_9BACL|nr:hypothetical protein [Effusibacillus dendaii]BCJ86502.1 hypothetical protein skT53_14870 [Effusibacillus dendaii]